MWNLLFNLQFNLEGYINDSSNNKQSFKVLDTTYNPSFMVVDR